MQREVFNEQILRLANRWSAYKSEELRKDLWAVLSKYPDDFMIDATRFFIVRSKGVPLLDEFEIEMNKWDRAQAERRYQNPGVPGAGSIHETLKQAARATAADSNDPNTKEFVRACMEALSQKLSGKLKMDQFLETCDMLDKVAKMLQAPKESNLLLPA